MQLNGFFERAKLFTEEVEGCFGIKFATSAFNWAYSDGKIT
ncbi:hypothetical protein [Acinetobacter guillouiae]|nr:hypothetical protein [Acinetobacter guillouiae]